jgi:hypothetical protein
MSLDTIGHLRFSLALQQKLRKRASRFFLCSSVSRKPEPGKKKKRVATLVHHFLFSLSPCANARSEEQRWVSRWHRVVGMDLALCCAGKSRRIGHCSSFSHAHFRETHPNATLLCATISPLLLSPIAPLDRLDTGRELPRRPRLNLLTFHILVHCFLFLVGNPPTETRAPACCTLVCSCFLPHSSCSFLTPLLFFLLFLSFVFFPLFISFFPLLFFPRRRPSRAS